MSAEELATFERSPFVADAVRVRRWDDGGKIPGMQTGSLDHFLEAALRQLQNT